jgi:hypothetical protein
MMNDWRLLPLPPRMRHLPLDPRGLPIFAMAYRDPDGRAHFTVNDEHIRQRLIRLDLCSICGQPLFRFRWFVGGDRSAFDPRGAYIDPPMHDECAHYALQVCPYLAAPSYSKSVAGKTISPHDPITLSSPTAILSPSTADQLRPTVFVAVLARGQRVTQGATFIIPKRPYVRFEYWRHGAQLERAEGDALCHNGSGQHG